MTFDEGAEADVARVGVDPTAPAAEDVIGVGDAHLLAGMYEGGGGGCRRRRGGGGIGREEERGVGDVVEIVWIGRR